MAGEPPTLWDLQRQINDMGKRQDRTDDRLLNFQREFVTTERLERELRHIVDDVKEVTVSQKEVATKLETAIEEQRKAGEKRAEEERKQRFSTTLIVVGWAVSLLIAIIAPVVVQGVLKT